MRWCLGPCGRELALECFRFNVGSTASDKRSRWCVVCTRWRDRQRYRRDVPGQRARALAYYYENANAVLDRRREAGA